MSACRIQQEVIISVKRRGCDNHNSRLTQATGEANISVDTYVTSKQDRETLKKINKRQKPEEGRRLHAGKFEAIIITVDLFFCSIIVPTRNTLAKTYSTFALNLFSLPI